MPIVSKTSKRRGKLSHPPKRKKKAVKPVPTRNIIRETHAWGVRLILRPFTDPRQNVGMEISAEISNPRPNHNPEIKIWFGGVSVQKPLPYTDSVIWGQALAIIQEEARKVAEELKAKKPTKKK